MESTTLIQSPSFTGRGKQPPIQNYDSVDTLSNSSDGVLDDAVSIGVKRLCATFIFCVLLWLISYIMVLLQVIDKGHFVSYTAFLFIPMWIGSIGGLVLIVFILRNVCKNGATLVSRERRLFMLAQGLELEQFIDFESLPLMRRLFFWSSVLATFLILTLTTQIFLYMWVVAGVIGIWHAAIPVLIEFAIIQIYFILVKTLSLASCTCFALSYLAVLLYTAKCMGELGLSWVVTCSPIITVQSGLMMHCLSIIIQACRGRLDLTMRQYFTLCGFMISITGASFAEYITISTEYTTLTVPFQLTAPMIRSVPMLCWIVVGITFTVSVLLTVEQELNRIASSRGYTDPIPLSRYRDGWAPVDGHREYTSLLLGVIKIPPLSSPTGKKSRRSRSQQGRRTGDEENGGEEVELDGEGEGEEQERRGRGAGTGTGRGTGRSPGRSSIGAQQRSRDERDEDEEEVVSVCVDHTGVAALICETARYVHRSITLFVKRTSIIQSTQRSHGSIDTPPAPAIELGSPSSLHYGTVRAVSGDLDGGNDDF